MVSWKFVTKSSRVATNAGLRVDDSRLCTIVGMAIAIPFKLYAVLIFLVFAGVWLALFFTVLNRSQFADTTCATLNGATYRSRRCPRALGISGVRSSRSGPCRTPCQGTACNTFSELSSSSTRRGRRRSLQKVLSRSWSWSPWCSLSLVESSGWSGTVMQRASRTRSLGTCYVVSYATCGFRLHAVCDVSCCTSYARWTCQPVVQRALFTGRASIRATRANLPIPANTPSFRECRRLFVAALAGA